MAAFNKFNQFVGDIAVKVHNLSSDAVKVVLTNTLPTAANALYSDVSGTELANGAGYLTGGSAPTVTSASQTSGTLKYILQPLVFTASASMGPFRYAVLYNTVPTSPLKPLIAWWDYGSSVTLASGETFTVNFDTTNGVLQIV